MRRIGESKGLPNRCFHENPKKHCYRGEGLHSRLLRGSLLHTRESRCLLGSENGNCVIHRGIGNYTPERIAQARKEIKRFQRLDQYGNRV